MESQIENLKKSLETTQSILGTIIHLLDKTNTVMEDGFNKVNERLAALEGKEGMQGVNQQLSEIKGELHKIQQVYPYEDLAINLKQITGKA